MTRLAPSPTGALHLGNIRTFLVNWALARREGWRVILRIEDLDTPRNKPGADRQAISTLDWIGIDWDEGPLYQSRDLAVYREAADSLARKGVIYPCAHTRTEVEAASAPNEGAHEVRFAPELRPGDISPCRFNFDGRNWRLTTRPGSVSFTDRFAGDVSFSPFEEVGDFVVWTRRDEPAYQLAVVVDDARQGVTQIVRGDDLLASTARQILVREALGIAAEPAYLHLPLVVGGDGRRLAKRHGDTRVDTYRALGASPERLIGLIAFWSGITRERATIDLHEFRARLSETNIPRQRIVYTPEDDHWLKQTH